VARLRGACVLDGSSGRLVVVGAIPERPCARCNHLRVAHQGTVEPCSGGWPGGSLRRLVRSRAGDDVVAEMVRQALAAPAGRLAGTPA
jgi:molybdenum cofactor biosynthesis enzyme MoaA